MSISRPATQSAPGRDGDLRLRRTHHSRRDQSRDRAPGQVYFLHNRVISIQKVRDRIAELCPGARVEFGHGQMDANELEDVMQRFVAGKIDVLICTTIIESGLDIPNANTIIIDRADRFGLADLYQLRGRVGRAEHKAYAYLLLPREMMTVGAARKRINAIQQYSSLGAGFRIAMRDLEIRGAGSILGTAQSGSHCRGWFDLYCQLLKQAVAQLKGEKSPTTAEVEIAWISSPQRKAKSCLRPRKARPRSFPQPTSAMPRSGFRPTGTAEITTSEQLQRLRRDWRDRFGKWPEAVDNLFFTQRNQAFSRPASRQPGRGAREGKLMLSRRGDLSLSVANFLA